MPADGLPLFSLTKSTLGDILTIIQRSPMAAEEPRQNVPPPYALALVVCDMIWRDPGTGKMTILGCFSTIGAIKFPATHPAMSVYAAATDGRGTVPIVLRLVDVDEEREPVFELMTDAVFPDPRAVIEMAFITSNIVFPEPGEYRLQLLAGADPMMERRIVALQVGAEENDKSEQQPDD